MSSEAMRMRALLCRLRQIHNMELPTSSMARPLRTLAVSPRVADSALGNGSIMMSQIGGVRCMGIGSHKEGNRAGQHGVRYPNLKPDGSPEKEEANAREQFLEKAKEESASNIDEAQKQTIGEATTELQFGVKDGRNTNEAISHASEELTKRTTIHGDETLEKA